MKKLLPNLLSTSALLGLCLFAGGASAQGTYTPGTGTSTNCNPTSSPLVSFNCTAGSVTATMTTWGYFGTLSNTTANTGWVQGTIGDFSGSGFGAYTGRYENSGGTTSATNGQHGFDNITSGCGTSTVSGNAGLDTRNSGCGGSVEGLLLNFNGAKVNLSQIGVGWLSGDADVSVYRWDGAAGGPTMGSQTLQSSATAAGSMAGWTLVGSPYDFATFPSTNNLTGNQYSSYFLITTYFGASQGGFDMGNDRFKLNTFTANLCVGTLTGGNGGNGGNGATCTPNQTPEPASLALVGVALAGAGFMRRRQQRAARA